MDFVHSFILTGIEAGLSLQFAWTDLFDTELVLLSLLMLADHSFKKVKVCLSPAELQMCNSGLPLSGHYITSPVWLHFFSTLLQKIFDVNQMENFFLCCHNDRHWAPETLTFY